VGREWVASLLINPSHSAVSKAFMYVHIHTQQQSGFKILTVARSSRIYKSIVQSVLRHGSESWVLTNP
jgi:hypothetical protein